jgi:DNA repair protein RecN (Recombination protein N)
MQMDGRINMLLQLNIKNFALIEKLSIEFDKGFNVLCGETGSGKSILIDAINFVLGGKFNKNLIRTGENKTYVEAIFTVKDEEIKKHLMKFDIDVDEFVIISRETFKSGKSIAKVNGKAFILSQLKKISGKLLDIHGQHENQSLLDSSKHIHYLDHYGNTKLCKEIENYKKKFFEAKKIQDKIDKLQGNEGERQKKSEFIKYQIDDIDKGQLKEGEDEELTKKFTFLSNSEKLDNVLSYCYNALYGGEREGYSVFDSVNLVIKKLRSIENCSGKIKEIADSLEESYYIIEQNIREISDVKSNIYYDKNELNYINERVYQIDNYKKKYGQSIKEILQYRDKINEEYTQLINSNEIINKLKEKKQQIIEDMEEKAKKIHDIRCKIAEELEVKIKNELDYIGLEKSNMKIQVHYCEHFNECGKNNVNFCMATNPGEPLRHLEHIVSGGELSRIMLALKTVFFNKDNIPTVIFDEIDTGISGRIAQCVGEKMYEISKNHQVFCVTHLPQIACMSDYGYLVSKKVIKQKTYTFVKKMKYSEKQLQIAKMIGGSEVTKLTLDHCKEMIEIAEKKKRNLA